MENAAGTSFTARPDNLLICRLLEGKRCKYLLTVRCARLSGSRFNFTPCAKGENHMDPTMGEINGLTTEPGASAFLGGAAELQTETTDNAVPATNYPIGAVDYN